MKTLEEIAYDAGRHALADQENFVNGIRQRTGTLLAAHALVASFLGTASLRADRLHGWSWVALAALVAGLIVAAVLLAPWRMVFALDARNVYEQLFDEGDHAAEGAAWLASAAFGYQGLRDKNVPRVRVMSALSGLFAVLTVVQTLAWVAVLLGKL